jgi:hypothetical protein
MKRGLTLRTAFGLAALTAMSCTTVDYKGDVLAPSDKVDVFFALEDIEQPHRVFGELKAHAQANKVGVERMQRKIVRAALDRGADALVYLTSETSEVQNHDLYQEFRDSEERPEFGPPESDTVRIVKALLVKYGEPPPASP